MQLLKTQSRYTGVSFFLSQNGIIVVKQHLQAKKRNECVIGARSVALEKIFTDKLP